MDNFEEHKGEIVQDEDIFSSINIPLFPHQNTSVRDLEKLEREKRRDIGNKYIEMTMGVFGDLPGFGKSLSLVALIDRDKMFWDLETPFEYEEIEAFGPSSTYITKRKIKKERLDCTFIVASTSIIGQWEKEMKRAGKIRCHTITKRAHMNIDPNDYHTILCSDAMYNTFVEKFEDYAWKRFIFDEAASTHIPSMKSVYAGFYWFVTATFPNLSKIRGRKQHFLKSIFSTISPLTFEYMLVKNDDEYVKRSYSIPIPITISHQCIKPGVLEVVGDMIGNDVIAMISAGNINGAINHLGGDDGPKNIIEIVTLNTREDLECAQRKVKENFPTRNKDSVHKERYKKWVDTVESLTKKLKTIKERFENYLRDEDCFICKDKIENPVLLPCCQQIGCIECITQWLKNHTSCPHCRTNIVIGDLISVTDRKSVEIEIEDDIEADSDGEERKEGERRNEKSLMKLPLNKKKKYEILNKQDKIIEIIKDKPNGKFIVFSLHDNTFDIIKKSFDDQHMKYVEIKGARETREKRLKMYQTGDLNTIFLNAKFNGAGINLEMTTDIIIYHEMDPLMKIQLIGRANRVGRIGPLTIHTLD